MVRSLAILLALCSTSGASGHQQLGQASEFCNWVTASGIPMNCAMFVAAHRTIKFRTPVTVKCNGRSVVVTIIDRGPFVAGRVIDLSPAAAHALGMNGLCNATLTW